MLRELYGAVDDPAGYRRRVFRDETFDLVVWLGPRRGIHGFQLTYHRRGRPSLALSWKQIGTAQVCEVDDGEQSPLHNRTPILRATHEPFHAEWLVKFEDAASALVPEIRCAVAEALRSYFLQRAGKGAISPPLRG